ncbi:fibronectin type-III domain-containing protein 3A-like isoform X3 [Mya arenaria]|uniref:fibronectin type-III domain-containing protein 3A-like isoform X3 n=1 Tax=Mya arenaria TaxID=6604 RepID=UPI0022E6ABB2|nr:fibronectin type-III domain-containing protein 3A-like isoform X3 [Mya arenaria]XP_052782736.1 fibronectin type-III domain-containing protein 3A-like isoform X3 [Mya arenaria]XP_052782737.1 fibronectin type-III domain-containing protein 3A-like isoform X3 [Mya arenaria]
MKKGEMKCTTDWETYDQNSPVMCSVCIEEYSGYTTGYSSNGYTQYNGYSGYGYNNGMYSNGYANVGYNRTDMSGPATVRMVSSNGPPLPMPMQVPPGHMVQQIVDENGILTHVILSPQPPGMMPTHMPGGPNSGPYYPGSYGGPYTNHPSQYPHQGPGPSPGAPGRGPQHMHGTPPPPGSCSNHNPVHTPGPNSHMDERTSKKQNQLRQKWRIRHENREHSGRTPPRRKQHNKGTNGIDVEPQTNVSSPDPGLTDQSEVEEDRKAIRAQLSQMPAPKVSLHTRCSVEVTDVESRTALIKLFPPDYDSEKYDIDASFFNYELMLCEKGRDGKYKLVYSGDASEITLKDLHPATEYHLKVCTLLDDIKGDTTEATSFKTIPCEPDAPQPPKLEKKSKTFINLKWTSPCENGSKISAYVLECDAGDGNFIEVFRGQQKQFRVAKLTASTKYTFRLAAINNSGKSEYSEAVVYCTSGSAPSQPDPPMLSEPYVTELLISWIKRPNDDEFTLQLDDEVSGHGFIPVYNGPLLSYRITKLRRNKEYKFRLCASNDEGASKWSEVVAYRTLPARPDTPSKPQLKGKIHPHVFRITWDPPKDTGGSEVTKYFVELDDGNGYESVFEGTEREHTCDRLTPGHNYRVRVAACSAGGRSEFSEVLTVVTQCVPPGQCSVPKLQGKPKATSLHLRWGYPEYNGGAQVTEFTAQMILPDNTSREVYKGRDLDCIIAGLSPGRPYLFQVRAFNRAGGGPWSEPLEVVSGAGVPDPPKMPLCQCRSPHSALISWEGPVNNGATITDYRLEWQLKPETDFTQIYYGSNTNFEVKSLSPATTYVFRVQAINSAGPGLYSPVATCVTPASSPSAVVSIRAHATATSVTLVWKEPHDNGSEITSYNIDMGGDKQPIPVSAVTEYQIEELIPESTYKVRIQAVNGIGVGAFSSVVKFSTRALPPRPPRLECCGSAHNSLKLKWGEGRNTDLITYTLEMDREDGNFIEVYKGQALNTKVNRLSEMTSYDFRIYASNDAGSGPYSETYTFSTTKAPPPALKAPKVENIMLTSCVVEWQTCRAMGGDSVTYVLQLQSKEHEYKQIYRGPETSFTIENLQCKSDYHVRVCAIRLCEDETEIHGAFSPGMIFSTLSPEPLKPILSQVNVPKVPESKKLTDQHLAAIFLCVFFVVAMLIAFIVSQFFPGSSGHDEV